MEASLVTESADLDFAVLKLEQTIHDRKPLVLQSDQEVRETENVYALGFPVAVQLSQDVNYYTKDDVYIASGIISKKTKINGISYIQHNAVLSPGNSGGPLLNSKGEVIGLNQAMVDDNYFYSIDIHEITGILDSFGIPYMTQKPEPEKEMGDVQLLKDELEKAQKIELKNMTEESVSAFQTVLTEAEKIAQQTSIGKEEMDQEISKIQAAQNALEKKETNWLLIVTIVFSVLFVIVIVLFLILIVKSKRGVVKVKDEKSYDTSAYYYRKRRIWKRKLYSLCYKQPC